MVLIPWPLDRVRRGLVNRATAHSWSIRKHMSKWITLFIILAVGYVLGRKVPQIGQAVGL